MNGRLDDQLREHAGLVSRLADSLGRRWQNEYDDLYQEGMIACWLAIRDGQPVTEEAVEHRMKKWLRLRRRQGRDVPTDYKEALPMTGHRQPEGPGPDEEG